MLVTIDPSDCIPPNLVSRRTSYRPHVSRKYKAGDRVRGLRKFCAVHQDEPGTYVSAYKTGQLGNPAYVIMCDDGVLRSFQVLKFI